jgi:hypothetical protein
VQHIVSCERFNLTTKYMALETAEIEKAALAVTEARRALAESEQQLQVAIRRAAGVLQGQDQNGNTSIEVIPPAPIPHINGEQGQSITERIVAVLESDPKKRWNYDEIAGHIPNTTAKSVRALLYRLEQNNRVKKAGRGLYRSLPLVPTN